MSHFADDDTLALIAQLEQQIATKDARIAEYEKALLAAFPNGASGQVFTHWNNARKGNC